MKKSILLFGLLFFAGALIVYDVHAATTTKNRPIDSQLTDQAFHIKAANLRLNLNMLLRESAAMGAETLEALYKGEDITGFTQVMQNNANQLANSVQNEYGKQAREMFLQLWMAHMTEYQNYTMGRKKDDSAAMSQARQHLQIIASKLGTLLSGSERPSQRQQSVVC